MNLGLVHAATTRMFWIARPAASNGRSGAFSRPYQRATRCVLLGNESGWPVLLLGLWPAASAGRFRRSVRLLGSHCSFIAVS